MALRITNGKNIMTVQTRTVGDQKPEKFRTESAFWFALKKELNQNHGHDVVKRIMSDDGHMVGGDGYPYYLRDRKWRFGIFDADYAVRDVAKAFNEHGSVTLRIQYWKD